MQIIRIYISYLVPKEIFASQILDWSEKLKTFNVSSFHYIYYYKEQEYYIKKLKDFDNLKLCKISKIIIIKDLQLLYLLIKIYKGLFNKNTLVITRDVSFSHVLIFLKFLFKFKLIYEIRAAGELSNITLYHKIKLTVFNIKESLLIKFSDKVFCVSNFLKNYKIKQFKIKKFNKFKVLWNVADSNIYFYDEYLRTKLRSELNIRENDVVIIYSGSLCNEWNESNFLVNFFDTILSINPKLKVFILSYDIDHFYNKYQNFINKYFERLLLKSISDKELNEYLNAADIALLLRFDYLLNFASSPIKFAEYILAGLPVIISASVKDFAKFTLDNDLGLVIENTIDLENKNSYEFARLMNILSRVKMYDRKRICQIGKIYLSKETYKQELYEIYISLVNSNKNVDKVKN